MATFSTSELYIVVCWIPYSGISGDTDTLYTNKEEAERAAEEASKPPPGYSTAIKHSVVTLSEYIDDVKREEYNNGQQSERDRGNW